MGHQPVAGYRRLQFFDDCERPLRHGILAEVCAHHVIGERYVRFRDTRSYIHTKIYIVEKKNALDMAQ